MSKSLKRCIIGETCPPFACHSPNRGSEDTHFHFHSSILFVFYRNRLTRCLSSFGEENKFPVYYILQMFFVQDNIAFISNKKFKRQNGSDRLENKFWSGTSGCSGVLR